MSIYEQLGGTEAIDAVVEQFYRRVLADPCVSRFFNAVDMDAQRAKQRAFLIMVLGGPHQYSGRDLREAHRGMEIDDSHYDAVAAHLADTLRELAVDEDGIQSALQVVEIARDAVLNR